MPQQGRPSAGDMTGRQKAQMAKTARADDVERAAEQSAATAEETEAEMFGTFDPQSGERIDSPAAARTAVAVAERPAPTGFPRQEQEPVLTGQEDPEVVAPIIAARKAFSAPPVERVRSAYVTIRVEHDVEDMTYGMVNGEPNNYTFKEGLRYSVPAAVAEHLNDLGLVRQWNA